MEFKNRYRKCTTYNSDRIDLLAFSDTFLYFIRYKVESAVSKEKPYYLQRKRILHITLSGSQNLVQAEQKYKQDGSEMCQAQVLLG